MALKRWQDWGNVILGAWLVISPWVLGFAEADSLAPPAAWILGVAIIVFAGMGVYVQKAWEEALSILLGVGLLASPWVLGYADQRTPTTNAVVVGLLVIALALWAMLTDGTVQKWWHEHYRPHPTR